MSRRKLVVSLIVVAMVVCLFSAVGLSAKQKVVFWSYAANNIEEWTAREADIEKKFNIDLQIEMIPQNAFVQTLQAAMMDGSGYPDIIEWMIEQNRILDADPKKCLVIPLDKYVAKSEAFKKVPEGRVAWTKYGGHVYGLPHDVHPVVLVYNDTLWKEVGVDVAKIKTWDEFFEAAKKLTAKKKADGSPMHYALPYDGGGLGATMWMIWNQTGAQVLDKNGKPIFTNKEFAEFVKWWVDKINTGMMCTWDWGNFGALLADGTLASYATPDWWIEQVNTAAAEGKYQFRMRDLPVYKKGGPRTASWGGTFMAITKLAKNQDKLYQIIEYMQYDEASLTKRYVDSRMIPPFSSVWNDEAFKQPDPRFGGQKTGVLLTDLADEIPSMNTGDIFWDAVFTDFNAEFTEMVAGNKSVEQGLKDAQAKAMRRVK
ncbi:MAG TPA: extracellular solute-binding protein [Firmicutes bacterium]|jgi:arabinosaccharide transport system substrate-binding protein|nr:extracellular solute-binding protein [Bacillota bacterium]